MSERVIIIGAGLSGLVDAILLAETGRRVLVLEQHRVPGGYLQQFRRSRTTFDVGFHYMGSSGPGRPMRQFLQHLGVWDRLELVPFPSDSAIEVMSEGRRFGYPTRFERFREKALSTWPGEREAVERFVEDVESVCSAFPWFHLKKEVRYPHPRDLQLSAGSLEEYLRARVKDPWLREVLEFQTFNLGLFADETPWVKYALAFRSNFDETCRIRGGGGALVEALVTRGRELGVEYRLRSAVTGFECERRYVRSVLVSGGERLSADLFVAACHPKPIARMIPDKDLPEIFKERLFGMRESRGAVQLFLVLRKPLSSIGSSCLLIREDAGAGPGPPLHTILVTYPPAIEGRAREGEAGPLRLEAMAYMDYAPFERWAGSPVLRRGFDYDRLKEDLAQRMIRILSGEIPELPDAIARVCTATPLTDEWYTKNERGGVFGVSHDVGLQGTDRPQPRMVLKNLFFTGHSINMPGICGVFVNSFDTINAVRGDGALFASVAT